MNSESLRRSARAMHRDSGSATREKAVITATIHYIRGRASELCMATHLEDAQRLSNVPYRLGSLIRPLWPPQTWQVARPGIHPRFLLTNHQKRFHAFPGPGLSRDLVHHSV